MRFEIRPAAARQSLLLEFAQHARADVLDKLELQPVRLAAVFARQQKLQRLRHIRKQRQRAHRAQRPLVIGHVAAVEQKDRLHGGAHELGQGQHRRSRFAVGQAAGIIILPRLRHRDDARGKLFAPHVLRHAALQRFTHGGKRAELVAPDLAVRGLGQRPGGQREPLLPALRRAGRAGIAPVKIADAPHAEAALGHHALCGGAPAAQLAIGAGERHAEARIVLVRQPQTKAAIKIVIARNGVVKAEALRSVPGEPDGDPIFHIAEALVQHRAALLLIEQPCLVKSAHGSHRSFPSNRRRRGKSRACRTPADTSTP